MREKNGLRPTGNAGELGAGPATVENAGLMKSVEDRTINHPVSPFPTDLAPMSLGLCGSFGGIFDDEFFAADFAGEISNLLNGFLSDCHLFPDHGGGID